MEIANKQFKKRQKDSISNSQMQSKEEIVPQQISIIKKNCEEPIQVYNTYNHVASNDNSCYYDNFFNMLKEENKNNRKASILTPKKNRPQAQTKNEKKKKNKLSDASFGLKQKNISMEIQNDNKLNMTNVNINKQKLTYQQVIPQIESLPKKIVEHIDFSKKDPKLLNNASSKHKEFTSHGCTTIDTNKKPKNTSCFLFQCFEF
jgi:hypothetical protein